MSSLHRSISADAPQGVLHVRLAAEAEFVEDAPLLAASGRNARTIVKHGPLRMTLVAVSAGGHIPAHRVDAPVSVHVLRGALQLRAGEHGYEAAAGDLLVLAPDIEHDVSSRDGALFLLTVIAG
jgi:quercetin dioxygenase-like cupin family protein